ncbi:MAG: type IX secretion system membrane protein PorP/SprF [Flavobacteriales bacterium]|nr:type IX secretion system membrane protein PorP/SprF [Flavobacteriales bacterium]MCB9195747.1 type IX secretion system membrane protein PorP/SprF [Flavobacteriales bacterium]
MKTLIKIAFIFILSVQYVQVKAQQDPMLSQYMFNGLFLNPAYAGSHRFFQSTLIYRRQWVNIQGAPQTFIAAVDGPVHREKMGLGLIIANDQIGVTNQTDFLANYSYNLKLGNGKLAFGIKAGVSQYRVKITDLTYWDEEDPIYAGNINGEIIPKFGAGVYYHQEKWFAGISIPTLLAYEKEYNFSININDASNLRRHLLITGGYVFTLNDNWKIKPSTLVKYTHAAPLQVDLNCNVLWKDMIWLGVSYRTGDSFVGMLEYQANDRFRIGYAHDFTTTQLRNYSSGTHEIMVGFDFGKDFAKVRTPRFF